MDNCGLSYVWETDLNYLNKNIAFKVINQCLEDSYRQNWQSEIHNNGLCSSYKIFKNNPEMESYILNLDLTLLRNLAKFRCGSVNIPTISGRYTDIPRDERNCTLCDRSVMGDEYHMLFECPFFHSERGNLIPKFYTMRPSALKFGLLMNENKKKVQVNLSKYCKTRPHIRDVYSSEPAIKVGITNYV